jgi:ribosomal protein S1
MGCFVHIFNVQNRLPAMVHSSQVREEATEDITKIVKEGLFVWVKVLEILPDRIRLTMKEVNQYNGR